VLWGTFAEQLIYSPSGVRSYFVAAFARKLSASVAAESIQVQEAGTVAICSGSYVVHTQVPGGIAAIHARFSLVVSLERGAWRIVNHHSSLSPTSKPGAGGA
jgi:hypothetical protein